MSHVSRVDEYTKEICSWLLGRVTKQRLMGGIERVGPAPMASRVRLWWMFEGRRYPWLDSSLAHAWKVIDRHAQRLLGTYNPTWSIVDVPEGETDWVASAFQALTAARPGFVTRAARPGLGNQERSALLGWLAWVHGKWSEYVNDVGPPAGIGLDLPWSAPDAPVRSQLYRWAHTAKRSRWPLMRNVVAESLRCFFEDQDVDRLSLPSKEEDIFELLCMVRILKALSAAPDHVRWLQHESGNRVDLPGLSYFYQRSLKKNAVLGTAEFAEELRRAIVRHDVGVPERVDGWLEFTSPRKGFHAILVEAKSGAQSFRAAVYQLKIYRAALAEKVSGRMLIWGIIETAPEGYTGAPLKLIRQEATEGGSGDLWLFSTADEIRAVLQSLGLAAEAGSESIREERELTSAAAVA